MNVLAKIMSVFWSIVTASLFIATLGLLIHGMFGWAWLASVGLGVSILTFIPIADQIK